jgi:gliding motility-associated-like protein
MYRIKAIDGNGNETSWSDTCQATPIYFNDVPSPTIQVGSVWEDKGIVIHWEHPQNSRNAIIGYELERSIQDSFSYTVIQTLEGYLENQFIDITSLHIHENQYYYRLKSIDACGDSSRYGNITRPILLKGFMNKDYLPFLSWTPYLDWSTGVDYYDIYQLFPHGDYEKIGRTTSGEDTFFTHYDVQMNCMEEYNYKVVAIQKTTSSDIQTSISNSVKVKVESTLFTTNAFIPNGDGLNDVFESKGVYLKSFKLKIYNQWGEKLYESDDCMPQWDGTYNGVPVTPGVYAVMISAEGVDDKWYQVKTDLTLLR